MFNEFVLKKMSKKVKLIIIQNSEKRPLNVCLRTILQKYRTLTSHRQIC